MTEQSVPWIPRAYMRRAVKWLLNNGSAALWLDPGLGKTAIVLAAISLMKKAGVLERVLVIAPLRVCYLVWPAEAKKWLDFNHLNIVVLHDKNKTDAQLEREDVDIFVINPDGLRWLFADKRRFRKLGADTLVVDESDAFKNTQTRRFAMLRPYLPYFRRRWTLTGTPASNSLLDLYGQVYIMDLGYALGSYYTHYRNKFFDSTGFGGFVWKLKEGADQLIYDALKPYVLRLAAADYLELPQLIVNDISVVLPPAARRVYDDMEEEMFAELDSLTNLTAVNAAALTVKLRQIANGAVYYEVFAGEDGETTSGRRWKEVHDAKMEAVKEYIDERHGAPTIVTYTFHHDKERLLKILGKHTPVLGGGTSPKRSAEIEALWNAGKIPVLLAQPSAMGHGLNMQKSGDAILWLGPIWDLNIYEQTIKRLLRQGSTNKRIFVTHIIAQNTVDLAIRASNRRKDKTQSSLLGALQQYRRDRNHGTPTKARSTVRRSA